MLSAALGGTRTGNQLHRKVTKSFVVHGCNNTIWLYCTSFLGFILQRRHLSELLLNVTLLLWNLKMPQPLLPKQQLLHISTKVIFLTLYPNGLPSLATNGDIGDIVSGPAANTGGAFSQEIYKAEDWLSVFCGSVIGGFCENHSLLSGLCLAFFSFLGDFIWPHIQAKHLPLQPPAVSTVPPSLSAWSPLPELTFKKRLTAVHHLHPETDQEEESRQSHSAADHWLLQEMHPN